MSDLLSILHREIVYIWYYFDLQLRQIFRYWVLGMAIGSAISVFAKNKIHGLFAGLQGKKLGLLVFVFYREKEFFDFEGFSERASRDTHPNLLIRYLLNFWRNVKATGGYFLAGILLSALFQRYVPQEMMVNVFGGNEAWGVLMAATIGVPLYACGGGTIPLLQTWLAGGMSMGSAAAFMITGPATKITNLGALKIAMGWKRFALYIAFVMAFAFGCGLIANV